VSKQPPHLCRELKTPCPGCGGNRMRATRLEPCGFDIVVFQGVCPSGCKISLELPVTSRLVEDVREATRPLKPSEKFLALHEKARLDGAVKRQPYGRPFAKLNSVADLNPAWQALLALLDSEAEAKQ
jgi:hypothetical protein